MSYGAPYSSTPMPGYGQPMGYPGQPMGYPMGQPMPGYGGPVGSVYGNSLSRQIPKIILTS